MVTRVAAVQMCSGGSPERNAADMARLVRDAASRGATYVQTPEMTGMLQRDRKAAREVLRGEADDLIVAAASALAADLKIVLHIGSTAIIRDDGKIANRGFLFAPDGKKICSYDKIHMFDVDLDNGESWRESSAYEPGGTSKVVDLPFGKLGMAICYDLRFPQLFRAQAMAGAQILTIPASFTRQTGEAHWEILMRARAIENGTFLIAAAQAGVHEDGRETYGNSLIVDPWGKILARAADAGEEVIVADIDIAAVSAARQKVPNLKNARDFVLENVPGPDADRGAGGVAA
ncbi:carbon-nitrogen hydrolase family protein [Neorhizobium sp. NCHU2750]|uniref:carbon-nitrogen hydrolase family protein n=1 Tax=Neorhizobium sp. NCHU2750 TaxID=1825976 RepID=UPI000E7399B9|nr:nitrilase [Neorhizobium sp. NCHU2750]